MFRSIITGMIAAGSALLLPQVALAQAASIELVESRLLGASVARSPASTGTEASQTQQSDKLALRAASTAAERGRSVLREAVRHSSATEARRGPSERGASHAGTAGLARGSGYQGEVAEQRQQRRGAGAGGPGAGAGRNGKGGGAH